MILPFAAGCAARRPAPQVLQLPDGTALKLEGVTFGKRHRLELRKTGLRGLFSGTEEQNVPTDHDSLVVWFSQPGSQSGGMANWPETRDEHGCGFNSSAHQNHSYLSGSWFGIPWPSPALCAWIPGTFPRRGKAVTLCFYDAERKVPVVKLAVPNPAPGPYPTWNAEPYPITKRSGNLGFTLESLQSAGGRHPWADARFRITENGRETRNWEPVEVTASDATGNVIGNPVKGRNLLAGGVEKGSFEVPFYGLCPYETAWKLRVEFAPTARAHLTLAVRKSRFAEFLARPSPPARKPEEKKRS